jgi:hypothetical protein
MSVNILYLYSVDFFFFYSGDFFSPTLYSFSNSTATCTQVRQRATFGFTEEALDCLSRYEVNTSTSNTFFKASLDVVLVACSMAVVTSASEKGAVGNTLGCVRMGPGSASRYLAL